MQERIDAADLFINAGLTMKQVSAIVGVSVKSLVQWSAEDEWETQRTAVNVTVEKIIAGYYLQIAAIQKKIRDEQENIPTAAQTDQQHKLADAIEKLKKKQNLSTYHLVFTDFLKDLNATNVDAAKVFAPLMLEFMKQKAKELRDDN